MSIQIIKDEINVFSGKQARTILSFLPRTDLKSFSHKRKLSNAVQASLINCFESKCSLIVPIKQRRRVFFADDVSLPSSEVASLVSKIVEHKVSAEEYKELINYRNCFSNEDFLDGMRRKCEEQRNQQ